MKVLKALVEVEHPNEGTTQYVGYPKAWLDNKEKIPTILYPQDRTDEMVQNGKTYQILYPVVPDDVATEMLKSPDFSLANPVELNAYSAKHLPQREIARDDIVLPILIKQARGEKLSPKDLNALDPNNPEPGVRMSEKFEDMARAYGADNI